ncbi:MAG TPA: glycosyl hydrolase family 18 protein [Solirubrobacteraceae bacterium]|nr:glycosyl hydrolase family 18 protein [Solirubrobacteraceae bacterium]
MATLAVLACGWAPVVVAAEPIRGVAATVGGLRAFVLASSPDSFADLQAHAGSIGVAYPTYFECSGEGSQVLGQDDPRLSEWIAAHGAALMPRYTCQEGLQVHRLLFDRSLRPHLLRQLVAIVQQHPLYSGLSLDLENDGAEDRALLTSFVAELAARLHALGRRLSVVVDGVTHEDARLSTAFYDERALGTLADEVFVMAWGVHWEGSAPGPIAPLGWVRQVARFVASLPHARRYVLGVPMYGLDWRVASPGPGGVRALGRAVAAQYAGVAALLARIGVHPHRDRRSGEMTVAYRRGGVLHRVWYLDARAIVARLRAGLNTGLHVGVWRLGSEDQALWSELP